jgi:hypothetical protein
MSLSLDDQRKLLRNYKDLKTSPSPMQVVYLSDSDDDDELQSSPSATCTGINLKGPRGPTIVANANVKINLSLNGASPVPGPPSTPRTPSSTPRRQHECGTPTRVGSRATTPRGAASPVAHRHSSSVRQESPSPSPVHGLFFCTAVTYVHQLVLQLRISVPSIVILKTLIPMAILRVSIARATHRGMLTHLLIICALQGKLGCPVDCTS